MRMAIGVLEKLPAACRDCMPIGMVRGTGKRADVQSSLEIGLLAQLGTTSTDKLSGR